MRCKNCGYVNDDSVSRCIKCNAVLSGTAGSGIREHRYESTQSEGFQPAQTVSEASGSMNRADRGTSKRARPEPSRREEYEDMHATAPIKSPGGTINPWAQKKGANCWLKSWDYKPGVGPKPGKGYTVNCQGDEFELTRNNTNPYDNTISSHQALLTHDNSGWYIEDTSTYHSTAIIVSRRTKLEEGDTIVLGSSRFVFTEVEPPTYT